MSENISIVIEDSGETISTQVNEAARGPAGSDASVTTTNVRAAGALMDDEVTNLAQVKSFSSADYATSAQGTLADSAVQPAALSDYLPLAGGVIAGHVDISSTANVDFLSTSYAGFASGSSADFASGSSLNLNTGSLAYFTSGTIKLAGSTYVTSINFTDPTAARAINFPDAEGDVILTASAQTLTDKTMVNFTEGVVSIGNSGTSKTISLADGTFQTVTITGNCTFTMPTATAGKSFILKVLTGAGSYTAAFTGVKWSGGTAPTITPTASKYDLISFVADGTAWSGSVIPNFTA